MLSDRAAEAKSKVRSKILEVRSADGDQVRKGNWTRPRDKRQARNDGRNRARARVQICIILGMLALILWVFVLIAGDGPVKSDEALCPCENRLRAVDGTDGWADQCMQ